MSLRLLLRDSPQRVFAVTGSSHTLVFRHNVAAPDNTNSSAPRCMVEFSAIDNVDLSGFRELSTATVQGTLGLVNINADVFLCTISGANRVATVRPGETIQKILSVDFYCLNRADFDRILHEEVNPYSTDNIAPSGHDYGHGTDSEESQFSHPCLELKRILSSGTFYYSVDFDLTNRLQDRLSEDSAFDIDSLEQEFLWNSYMIDPLINFRSRLSTLERQYLDGSRILTSAIRGFVSSLTISPSVSPIKGVESNYPSTLTLISRLSSRRAGTRFNSRGIDDDGNVANFVETETILWHPSGLCFSYAQIRGSVPVFWEQAPGLLPGQQKIEITRSPEGTQPAFDLHFEHLASAYGVVHVVNLLSESKPGEVELTSRYRYHVHHSSLNQVIEIGGSSNSQILEASEFDFHAETRGPGGYEAASMVKRLIRDRSENFAYFLCDDAGSTVAASGPDDERTQRGATVVLQQEGVFRTNCLDCLDRTNLIQTIISQMGIEAFLGHRNERAASDFWMRHSNIWADNGDALSKIYAGTGALKSSFTRHGKMSLAGALADVRKSATRMYINNFADKGRQNTIDMLLGRLVGQAPVHLFDPINDYVNAELKKREDDYLATEDIKIWVGTFNLNGRGKGVHEDLSAWLCPQVQRLQQNPDIVAVGFQEIVELSPQQIMATDPIRRQAWEDAVRKTLNENAKRGRSEEYIMLRSGQLVGAALMVFVKSSVLKNIKNVEGSVKKTGMSGMAGNKGAVAIRMDYANTRICFVTAHLAAGFANYEERNRDYRTISHGLRFQRNRSIEDHDTIIWLGDFNYRIGLSDDKVRRLIQAGDLETLYSNDQLNLQMVAGRTFPHYSEARITFMPTYKYNNGTDDYDTSEKARIPAWCDRVLRKGVNLRQINYTTAPLRFSDHRPVYATFQCTVSKIDEQVKKSLSQEIYTKRMLEIGNASATSRNSSVDEEDSLSYESIAPGLPPASSGRRKWWLDNGLPARSTVQPPSKSSILNSQRPSNPFTPTSEPDWVTMSRPNPSQHSSHRSTNSARNISTSTASRKLSLPPKPNHSLSNTLQSAQETPGNIHRPHSPSTSSVASSGSSTISRKTAPPIPKKPALLSSPSKEQSPTARSLPKTNSSRATTKPSVPPPRQASGLSTDGRNTIMPTRQIISSSPQAPTEHDGPALPPRRAVGSEKSSVKLMDEDGAAVVGIPSLQPLQPLQRQRKG